MPREERYTVRDIAVRLWRDGQGALLIYLHGAAGVPPWLPFFGALAAKHQVLMPEHPGFGDSDNPPWIRNVGDMAMYYLDFLDKLGERVHVVAHSLGGWIAAEAAVRNCSRIASLSLLDPAGVRVKGVPSGDNFIWAPDELARNLFYDQSFAEQMIAQVPSEQDADRVLTNRFMAAKLGWEPRWFNPALERWLHRISVPTFVLWGRDDKIMPAAYAKVWQQRVPNVQVEILPECGHLPFVEKGAGAAQKILAFVDGVRS
jgi:pimeloyl-ACP methyl ester carboxylesterase